MLSLKNKSGMSMVEILVATIVLSVVLLCAGSMYVSGIREFIRIVDEARVQTELSIALDHIHKNLMGSSDIVAIDPGTFVEIPWPAVASIVEITGASGDVMQYSIDAADNTLVFTKLGSGPEKIAKYITSLSFTKPLRKEDGTVIENYISIEASARKDRMQKALSTGAVLRGMPS